VLERGRAPRPCVWFRSDDVVIRRALVEHEPHCATPGRRGSTDRPRGSPRGARSRRRPRAARSARAAPRSSGQTTPRRGVDLLRPERAQCADERELVVDVRLDHLDAVADAGEVRVARRAAADDAQDVVALLEQELGEQGSVLPADTRDERCGSPSRRADDRRLIDARRARSATRRPARAGATPRAFRRTAQDPRRRPATRR
jgi:hypothetical protein